MSDKGKRAAAAAAVAAGATLGFAGTAGAATVPATVSVDRACYVTVGHKRPPIVVTGSGFPAGDTVDISDSTGTFITHAPVGPNGTFTATGAAPYAFLLKPGERRDTITATDFSLDGNEYVGSATTHLTDMLVTAQSRRGRGLSALRMKTRWAFSGFPEGREIWGHYLYRNKVVVRQEFGRAKGPCGLLSARKPMYPARPHHRLYGIQIDARKRYSKHTAPRFVSKIGLRVF
ncbi:MAG TPA: hypothetical protein VKV21_15310 [Solirubrobacteraceae bacterium]|nr:hypothetical protein [Solirubrobacteraceae bacterium]